MVIGSEVEARSTVLKDESGALRDDSASEVVRDAIDEGTRISLLICDAEVNGVAGLVHPDQIAWICDICRSSWVK